MSLNKKLHIVCPTAPWPLSSGSQIDQFYRIRSLHAAGIGITLHYFTNPGERHPTELNPYCEEIVVYPLALKGPRTLPKSIRLRTDSTLLRRLQQDDHPVLIESLACCSILHPLTKNNRTIVVRIQQLHHRHLQERALQTRNPLQRVLWYFERKKLLRFTKQLPAKVTYICCNETQARYYRETLGIGSAYSLPAFSPYDHLRAKEGIGSFCLFQGNLAEPETEKIVDWLLTRVFSRVQIPFVIAGKDPSARIEKLVHLYQHTCLVANPGETELDDLIQKAQINILPASVSVGTGIRLLHAVSLGRHCICNHKALMDTPFKETCHSAETAEGIAYLLTALQYRPFGEEEIVLRKKLLKEHFDTQQSTDALIRYLW